jgi:hypothetical protein
MLHNVLDIGIVPKGRYKYHQERYRKANKPFELIQSWGFRLMNQRKYTLPDPCVRALIRIYSRSTPVVSQRNAYNVYAEKVSFERKREAALQRAAAAREKARERAKQIDANNAKASVFAGRSINGTIVLLGGQANKSLW